MQKKYLTKSNIHLKLKKKSLNKLVIKEMYLNVLKTIYDKSIANIIFNSEKLFLQDQEKDKGAHSHHLYSTWY